MNLFSRPDFLYAIPVITVFLGLVYWSSQRKARLRIQKLVSLKLEQSIITHFSEKKRWMKLILFLSGICLIIVASAGPQWGVSERKLASRMIDILLAVDVSRSMLQEDIKPNRLERVKSHIKMGTENSKGIRFGLIKFSNNANLECNFTSDTASFFLYLDNLSVDPNFGTGTDFEKPIEKALLSFSEDDNDKFLILITDGIDREGNALVSAKRAAQEGITIYPIGVGKSNSNLPVDADLLKEMASTTNGEYILCGSKGEGIKYVMKKLKGLGEKKLRDQNSTSLPIDRYQFFVILALFFLLLEYFTFTSKTK
jgi:Ca-activated chloride channel family protein